MIRKFTTIVLLLGVLLSSSCVTLDKFASVGTEPRMAMVHQREFSDCAVASLAMITGKRYEDIYKTVQALNINLDQQRGLHVDEVLVIARAHGTKLELDLTLNAVQENGILFVKWTNPDMQNWHAVVLYEQGIYDPAQTFMQPYQYEVAQQKWTVQYFLKKVN